MECVLDQNEPDEETYYLPHHGVIRSDKETTKLQVVFNGSAKPDNTNLSINECLETGPKLEPHLFDVIIKFRVYPIAIVADIENAFHQVLIAPEDRCILSSVLQHPFNKHQDQAPDIVPLLQDSFYVDDLATVHQMIKKRIEFTNSHLTVRCDPFWIANRGINLHKLISRLAIQKGLQVPVQRR